MSLTSHLPPFPTIPPKLPLIRNSSPQSPASSLSLLFSPSTTHSVGSTPPDSPLLTSTTNPSSAGSPLAGEPPSALPCANPPSLVLSPLSPISLSQSKTLTSIPFSLLQFSSSSQLLYKTSLSNPTNIGRSNSNHRSSVLIQYQSI